MSLQGRVVIVTGAGQGIGRGVAKAYAELGASVVAAEMNETAGSKVIEEINSSGGTGLFVPCDVRQEADIIRLMAAAHERFGRIDVLINNAGVSRSV